MLYHFHFGIKILYKQKIHLTTCLLQCYIVTDNVCGA
jgi:hypothetical protein